MIGLSSFQEDDSQFTRKAIKRREDKMSMITKDDPLLFTVKQCDISLRCLPEGLKTEKQFCVRFRSSS